MKLTHIAFASAVVAALTPALAQAELSFNVGVVSLYKSSGIDQDNRAANNESFIPALQGGVDYDFGNGFYLSNWNSTGKFGAADLEIDLVAGYKNELGNGLSYDFSLARYVYPNEYSWNASEWIFSVSYGIATVTYKRGFFADTHPDRLSVGIEQPINDKLTFSAELGFRNNENNDGANDYSLGLSYDLGNGLSTSATLSGAEKTPAVGDLGKTRLVVGVSKSF